MTRHITPQTTLDNLKKEAKRWLKALRGGDAEARERFARAYPRTGANPVLRDVQHALAVEYGMANWAALKAAVETVNVGPSTAASADVAKYEQLATDMVTVYASGDAAAMQRINEHYSQSFTPDDFRAMVWRLMYKVRQAGGAAEAFAAPEAQEMVARTSGFGDWKALAEAIASGVPSPVPAYEIDPKENRIAPRRTLSPKEWDSIIGVMKERRITSLEANGWMTDELLKRIAELDFVTRLNLGGSRALTDDGLLHLARMPQLQYLNLSEYPGGKLTDRGLDALRHLRDLRSFEMTWQRGISDAGVANLKACERLESVNLMGTPTGDGAIEALRGKPHLRQFQSGRLVTDAGLPLLHDFPMLKTWRGEPPSDGDSLPSQLLIDGPFTNAGLAALAGLEGVFALDLFWHATAITPDGFRALHQLPNLGYLGADGEITNDTAMRHIAALPRLRKLRAQGTPATDEGFIALSRSQTIEEIWGRECPNLGGRGFAALSKMPRLASLGVSCRNVDDTALAALPHFPSLRKLTPIDVKDDGFRHVGGCAGLENLCCMYCRDTTDVATEYIAGLRLKKYYAGLTQITDRSLELLARMPSLEIIEFYECRRLTDAGVAHLAALPNLREIHLAGLPHVTLAATSVFPARVRVHYNV